MEMLCEGVPYPTRRALDTRAFRRCVAGSPARRSPCMLRWSKSLSGRLVTQPLRRRPCSSVHGTSTSFGGLSPGLAGASVPSSSSHMMYSTSILGNQSAGNRHAVCNRPNFSNGLEGRTGRHFSAASGSPSEEPSSPPKKTELKKKKSAAGGDASTDAPTLAPGSPVAESKPSLTTRAAALARKGLIDFPILAASKTYEFFRLMIQEPKVFAAKSRELWQHTKDELKHYWLGSKLLWQEIRLSSGLLSRVLTGHTLTRRERQQLLKTSADMFRLVPFAVFVIVPFMELLLPLTLKLFPNMLPSTFETASKKETDLQKQLKLRMDMAVFLQDTVQEMAKGMVNQGSPAGEKGAKELLSLIDDVRSGKPLSNEAIVACAKIFKDEVTLDNISRAQLVGMSRYMGLNQYGTDGLLRFQLRSKIREIKADDQMILWEGIDSLDMDELRKACADRGMRATGLTEAAYRRQLRQWLDLSINKAVPTTLLILSRAFTITSQVQVDPERAIQDSISSLDEEVLREAIVESAGAVTKADAGVLREMKLESLEFQAEMMESERQDPAVVSVAVEAPPVLSPPEAVPAPTLSPLPLSVPLPSSAASAPLPPPSSEAGAVLSDALSFALEAGAIDAQKELLEKVKSTRLKIEGQALLSKGRIKAGGAEAEATPTVANDEKSMLNVKRKLDKMLKAIEDDLDKAEDKLEDKMKALAGTPDKLRASKELHDAVVEILDSKNADEAAAAIARHLKEFESGAVTADELKEFAAMVQHGPELQAVKAEEAHAPKL